MIVQFCSKGWSGVGLQNDLKGPRVYGTCVQYR